MANAVDASKMGKKREEWLVHFCQRLGKMGHLMGKRAKLDRFNTDLADWMDLRRFFDA